MYIEEVSRRRLLAKYVSLRLLSSDPDLVQTVLNSRSSPIS